MKTLYTTIAFLLSFNLIAQDSTYSKVYFDNTIDMETYAADNTIDSGYVMVGMNGGNEALIIRLDSLSNELWSKTISGSTGQLMFSDVIATSDSGFVATGMNNLQAFCVKFNQYGDTLWTRTYGNGYSDGTYVTETFDSNYVFTWGSYQGTKTNVCKIDINANTLWSSQFNGSTASVPRVVEESLDSSIYIGGGTSWNSGMILKLSHDGQMTWSKGLDIGQVNDLEFFEDSIFILSADFNFSTGAVIKIDTAANISWGKRYPGYMDGSGNNMHIRGYLNKDSTIIFSIPTLAAGGNNINRIDLYGNLTQNMSVQMGTTDILPSTNYGSYLLGNGPVFGLKMVWNPHIGVVRTDSSLLEENDWCISTGWGGSVTPVTASLTDLTYSNLGSVGQIQSSLTEGNYTYLSDFNCVDFIGSIDEFQMELGVSIYPNSSNGIFNLETDASGVLEVNIFDQLGQIIYDNQSNSSNLLIDLTNQKSGVYYYQAVEIKSGKSAIGKMVIVD